MDPEKKPAKLSARNWIVIFAVLALAAALLLVSRFLGPDNSLSGDEIQAMMSALPTVSPAPTDDPAEETPAPTPSGKRNSAHSSRAPGRLRM